MGILSGIKRIFGSKQQAITDVFHGDPKKWQMYSASIEDGYARIMKVKQWEFDVFFREELWFKNFHKAIAEQPPNPEPLGKTIGTIYGMLDHQQDQAINRSRDVGKILRELKKIPAIDLSELRTRVERFHGSKSRHVVEDIVRCQTILVNALKK